MVLEILLIVAIFLWFLTLLPVPGASNFAWSTNWLAWICVLLLTLFLFVPGLRGA